jgi:ketosteroid isomerase-like protein
MTVPPPSRELYKAVTKSREFAVAANPAIGMFTWWNDAVRSEAGFTPAGFAVFFTDDAALIVNGDTRAVGLDGLARHFEAIRHALDSVSIRLPLEQEFRAGDRAFVHYRVDAVAHGVAASEEAMGYLQLRDERIAVMNVLARDLA